MALNRAAFEQRMEKLNASQQSIEGTSSWCTMWRSDAETLVGWWETYFHQADEKKKLSLVYLANDILQTSRKKGPEFVQAFFKVLPRVLRSFLKKADEKTQNALNKVISVWEQRRVFGSASSKLKKLIDEAEVYEEGKQTRVEQQPTGSEHVKHHQSMIEQKSDSDVRPSHPGVPPMMEQVVAKMQYIYEAHQKVGIAEHAYDAVMNSGADSVVLDSTLQTYKEALREEMRARENIVDELKLMIEEQQKQYTIALGVLSTLPKTDGEEQIVETGVMIPQAIGQAPQRDATEVLVPPENHIEEENLNKDGDRQNEASDIAEKVMSNPQALLDLLSSMQQQTPNQPPADYDPTNY